MKDCRRNQIWIYLFVCLFFVFCGFVFFRSFVKGICLGLFCWKSVKMKRKREQRLKKRKNMLFCNDSYFFSRLCQIVSVCEKSGTLTAFHVWSR